MTSPICNVSDNGGAAQSTTNGVDVADDGTVVTIILADQGGVRVWGLEIANSDDQVVRPTLTVDGTTKTATFTKPAGPWALLFLSSVTDGFGNVSTTTFGVYVKTASKQLRLAAANERAEGSAAFGWTTKFNAVTRAVESGGGGGGTTVNATSNNVDATITATTGTIVQPFKGLTAAHALNLPAAPTTGMIVTAYVEDATLTDANYIVWTPGGGKTITRTGTAGAAATFNQTKTISGPNGSLSAMYDGTLWRFLN